MKPKRSQPGRPPIYGNRAMMLRPHSLRLPEPMLQELDAIVASRAGADAPDRSQVIRELLAEAIAARRAKGKR